MSQTLFRQQVLQQQGERLHGDLLLSQPLGLRLFTALLCTLFLLLGSFLFYNDYSRKQEVRGSLVSDQGVLNISPPQTGRLVDLQVSQGAQVQAGQFLFALQVDQRISTEQSLSEELLADIARNRVLLEQTMVLEQQQLQLNQEKLQRRAQRQRVELDQLRQAQSLELSLQTLKQRAEARALHLQERGLLAGGDFEQVQAELLRQQNVVLTLARDIDRLEAELSDLASEEQLLQVEFQHRHAEAQQQLLQLLQQKSRISAEHENRVFAPITGEISSLNAHPGQLLPAGQAVLSIIPEDATLQAKFLVPSRAIGFLQVRQSVKIRYDAFPYQKFGVFRGTISRISRSPLSAEQGVAGSSGTGEAMYSVVADLEQQFVEAYGEALPLVPGMNLSADIELDQRSLLEWLLDPLLSLKGVL